MDTFNKTQEAGITSLESLGTRATGPCHTNIEQKIERDGLLLKSLGLDYDDFIAHVLEVIAGLEHTGDGKLLTMREANEEITAARFRTGERRFLSLKLLIE